MLGDFIKRRWGEFSELNFAFLYLPDQINRSFESVIF